MRVLAALLLLAVCAAADPPRVLVLMSYHRGMPWEDGVAVGLQECLGEDIEPVYVHHDVKRFPDRARVPELLAVTRRLIAGARPVAVLAVDDYAWDLAQQHRAELFPDLPIVFCGVNFWDGATRPPRSTGVVEGTDPAATVRLALRLHPGVRRLTVVNDPTETGAANRRRLEGELPAVLAGRELAWLGDGTFAETAAALARLDPVRDLVLVMSSNLDRAGAVRSYAQAAAAIRAACRAPVYAAWDLYYDRGLVGGYLLDARSHGRRAGELVRRVIAGEAPESIPVETRPTVRLSLDARELARFGVDRALIPPEAEILHDTVSFWQVHGLTILVSAGIILAQSVTIGALLLARRRRRRAEAVARRAEERLRQSQRMDAIGQLAAGVAHDFNNVLAAVLGHAELLGLKLGDRPDLAEHTRIIADAAQRASGTVRNLLTFARGRRDEGGQCDLDQVLADVGSLLGHSLNKRISLLCDPGAGSGVRLGADLLQQVLINLALNARDAMPDGGRLSITSRPCQVAGGLAAELGLPPGAYATVTVSDSGAGIPAAVQARIFEPFFTTKAVGAGTGLGLSMVHGAVTGAGGAVRVESAPGRGTTFTLWLPACALPRPASSSLSLPPQALHLLLVDDDPVVLVTTAAQLRAVGCTVVEVADPEAAEAAVSEGINAVVLDGDMPRLPGWELAARLRRRHPRLPVIALTGAGTASAIAAWNAAGVAAIVAKPITGEALAASVATALRR